MEKISLPNIYRTAACFFVIAMIITVVYLAVDVVAPLLIALLLAILARPIVRFLNARWKFPHILAVAIVVVLGALLILGIATFLGFQIASFTDDLPKIKDNLSHHVTTAQEWLQQQFGMSVEEQDAMVSDALSGGQVFSVSSLGSITNTFMYVFLIPIFTFLILIYRSLLLNFIIKLVPDSEVMAIKDILQDIKSVVRSYIVGLGMQVLVVSLLTGVGYALIGVKYFIFLAIFTGLLNLIPYIGIIIACVVSCLLTLASGDDILQIVWVLVVNAVVQMVDNNILQPKIVGSKVSINALASIVGVIIGGSIAGIPGMFLAIPVLAILKVIFANVKGMEPFAYIIADDIPKSFDWNKIRLIYTRKMREAEKLEEENNEQVNS